MFCLPMFCCGQDSVRREDEMAELRRATTVVQELSDRYRRAQAVVEAARSLSRSAQGTAENAGFVTLPTVGMNALSEALAGFDASERK
jgi:hypothetical protein